jgi:hypothetical protein
MPNFNGGSFARFTSRSPFSDAEERKFASDLLEVTNEAELEQVLGGLFKTASKGIEPAGSKVNGPVEGLLKAVAKKALPSVKAAVGASFGAPERDATAGRLGSLVNQALRAKVAEMTAADPDLEKCRRLFEKYRQFVRLAGKATRAAASAPAGVAPVSIAQKILMDSAKEALRRKPLSAGLPRTFVEGPLGAAAMKPTGRSSKFAEAAQAAAAAKTGVIGGAARRETPKGREALGGRVCSVCDLPTGSCKCWKAGRTGRWFRDGTRIVVNC